MADIILTGAKEVEDGWVAHCNFCGDSPEVREEKWDAIWDALYHLEYHKLPESADG